MDKEKYQIFQRVRTERGAYTKFRRKRYLYFKHTGQLNNYYLLKAIREKARQKTKPMVIKKEEKISLLSQIIKILNKLIVALGQLLKIKKKKKEYTKEEIKEIISQIAIQYGVAPQLAIRVAECESGLNPDAVNVNPKGSKDRGLFQWNDYWHPEISDECTFDVRCSTEAFCKTVKEGHLNWWNASKKCWSK